MSSSDLTSQLSKLRSFKILPKSTSPQYSNQIFLSRLMSAKKRLNLSWRPKTGESTVPCAHWSSTVTRFISFTPDQTPEWRSQVSLVSSSPRPYQPDLPLKVLSTGDDHLYYSNHIRKDPPPQGSRQHTNGTPAAMSKLMSRLSVRLLHGLSCICKDHTRPFAMALGSLQTVTPPIPPLSDTIKGWMRLEMTSEAD